MKKKALYFYCTIFIVICQVVLGLLFGTSVNAANVNNFYFESFDADYYLTKAADGTSALRVVENVTAVFPDYNQNKGICRQIAYTNQGGANVTLPDLTTRNLQLTRNGEYEPIYSIEKANGYYSVCTGNENYVHGRQTYTFEYNFSKVVTEFDDYQELYWDTNGNGAVQRFDKVTARVHFDQADYDGQSWCYVGKYGEKGEGRCRVTKISDGLEFSAERLASYENLTFDILLKPGAFVVPEPPKNYILIILLCGAVVICGVLLIGPIKRYREQDEKRRYYKGLFVKPEYQPHAKYSLAEMIGVYMGKKANNKVAALLEMIVKKKIAIYNAGEGAFRRKKWGIMVLDLDAMTEDERVLVQILKGGAAVATGDKFVVQSRTATRHLIELGEQYDRDIVTDLKNDKLVTDKYKSSEVTASAAGSVAYAIIVGTMVMLMVVGMAVLVFGDMIQGVTSGSFGAGEMVGGRGVLIAIAGVVFVTILVRAILSGGARKYAVRTREGLEMSRYMDGLKMYIEMAEAERMKLLQSVQGAEVTNAGVVKLHEKLLPYAAVFGLEESWMRELEAYYKMDNMAQPEWYRAGITTNDMIMVSRMMSNYSRIATTMASSGGASSSGSSGSFGGGFSGGGGGGGGFSGR